MCTDYLCCSGSGSLPASRVSPRRATYFSLPRQRNLRKRKATRWSGSFWGQSPNSPNLRLALRLRCPAPLRNGCLTPITFNLRCSVKAGSRSNSASPQTIASPDPLLPALLGPTRRVGEGSGETMTRFARHRRSTGPPFLHAGATPAAK